MGQDIINYFISAQSDFKFSNLINFCKQIMVINNQDYNEVKSRATECLCRIYTTVISTGLNASEYIDYLNICYNVYNNN